MEYSEFKGLVRRIKHDDGVVECLDTLADSVFFSRMSVFDVDRWDRVLSFDHNDGIDRLDKWKSSVVAGLFLAIKTIHETLIESDADDIYSSDLYHYIRNRVRNEIEKELYGGRTLYQETNIDEEWPVEDDYDEDGECVFDFQDKSVDVETEVFDRVLLDQVRCMVSDKEWAIITAEHGDGPMLAEYYGTTVNNIWVIKHRVIKQLQEEFCKE